MGPLVNLFIFVGMYFIITPRIITSSETCQSHYWGWIGWSSWGEWSSCDQTCGGGGNRLRRKYCYYYGDIIFSTDPKTEVSSCGDTCLNQGIFINSKCFCKAGYTGECCQDAPVCRPSCVNNGTCIGRDTCKCEAGFFGKRCEIGAAFDKSLTPQLHTTFSEDTLYIPLSWYDAPAYDSSNKACFIKVHVQDASYDTILTAESMSSNETEAFGNFTVAPIDSSARTNGSSRVACLQVRCPSTLNSGQDFDVVVSVSLETRYKTCQVSNKASKAMSIYISSNGQGDESFTMVLESGNNYGPMYGVYMNSGYREKAIYLAQQSCYSGRSFDYDHLNPTSGILASFSCS